MVTYSTFILAYVFFAAGAIWSIASWLNSETLAKARPRPVPPKKATKPKHRTARRHFNLRRWGISAAIAALYVIAIALTHYFERQERLRLLHDVLLPASDPLPPDRCGTKRPPNSLLIYYGGSMSYATQFPYPVFSYRRESLVTLDQDRRGDLTLSAEVRSPDGRYIAKIVKNEFTVNPNNIMRMTRPDRSTLIITDQYGETALNVRYLNPQAVRFLGRLYYRAGEAFDVTEHSFTVRGVTFIDTCIQGAKGGAHVG
jgi:hypothetical protein